MKKKLVYLSSIAAPHQIKLNKALNKYFDSTFIFYDDVGSRASWWKIELGHKNLQLNKVWLKKSKRYISIDVFNILNRINPDVVMLGGFSIPGNILVYAWAKFKGKKTVVFTERSRNKNGTLRSKSAIWKCLGWIYRNVDIVMVSEEDIVPQFRDEFGFGDKVYASRYAADIEDYLSHPIRKPKEGYTYMFANRLTDIYNPLEAIFIFNEIQLKYPNSKLVMNALGELRSDCENAINDLGIDNKVEFLDNIVSWDKLHEEYRRCDILLFPAKFSNGNFTIIEAMASGMGIVISDNILGVGNYIKDGKNGFRIPLNRELFIHKIEEYINNPKLLFEHSQLNRQKVEPLGPDGTARLYYSIITNLGI